MKELIINSKKYGKQIIIYDEIDHELISKYTWCVVKDGRRLYAATRVRYISGKQRQKVFRMHQLILGFPKQIIDHCNGNGLDNTRKNIRLANILENARNRAPSTNKKSSIYKGVYWIKSDKLFVSRIYYNKKRIYLGSFKKEIDAAKAYNNAAIKYFGEFAYLNEISHENTSNN